MTTLFSEELQAALEAVLFAATESLTEEKLATILGISQEEVQEQLQKLQEDLQRPERGLTLLQGTEGWRLVTKPVFAHYIEHLFRPQQSNFLSKAALETLAIIAYRQPITRSEIELIRGVKTEKAINTLLERGLIKEVGRREGLGKPILYGTTEMFLSHFGLQSLADLPPLEEFLTALEE
ncbi:MULTISPECIES: SMC-Scp complex subunit ScpB [unclassified Carboxydocella]|uniref:SMC-Scp complex subunit ScpB n=1 Tax=unclassified Carboxydocella TaxID=2685367 RepID=UPI0009AD0CAD|nr:MULTISPECIES: SMC-Scp complex subunit ScpB [unclassified Carboxydocella]GAW30059.1 SMC-Scp complex subunit ScpB [Carboxydocella sp. ULO1]GAW31201.1 SMC-Scp complex subunit ScpB [Carboxydocella sp. JDF658]